MKKVELMWVSKDGFEYVRIDGKVYILLDNMLKELEKIRGIIKK
jgi:hypothetical protein